MKHLITTLFIVMLIFLSGCSTGTSTVNNADSTLFKGTQGVVVRFLDNLPPSKIYMTQGSESFDISVEVKNLGTHSLGRGELFFSFGGLDSNIVSYPTQILGLQNDLNGKTSYMPEGGFTIESLGQINPNENEIGSEYNPTLVLSAYYNYETRATVPFCVDPNAYNPQITSSACSTGDVTLSGGQGAPVAVTKVEQITSPDKIIFKIYFSNVGGGTLFTTDALDGQTIQNAAENGINIQSQDKIRATVKLGSGLLDCKPANKAFRINDIFYCTYNIPSNVKEAYSTVLDITAEYGYKETVRKNLNIINLEN